MGGLRAAAQGPGRLRIINLKRSAEAHLQLLQGLYEAGSKHLQQRAFYKCYFFVYSSYVTLGVEETSETLKAFEVFLLYER